MAKSRVQEYITGAMFELLEKKDYTHITVQDLVDRAGVCRASFYRNRVSVAFYRQTLEQIRHLQVQNNKYQPYFFSGASAAMLCAWVENDFAESSEEMARIFMGSLRGYMELA